MSYELGAPNGAGKDRRAEARLKEESLVANAILDLAKNCTIICSRQGDLLESVLHNMKANNYDIEKLSEDVTKLLKKVVKRLRRYS